jgi:hypothetical protein
VLPVYYNWCTVCLTGAVCATGGLNAEICAAQLSKPSISPALAAECIGTEASDYYYFILSSLSFIKTVFFETICFFSSK